VTAEQTPSFDLLILGASFAGVELVYQLRKRRSALRVAVVDRQAEHGYIPLVQERLVARIPPEQTALPTRAYVESRPGSRYILGEVASFDPQSREVTLVSGERLRARFVVVALGSALAPPPRLPGAERFVGYKLGGEFAAAREALARTLAGQGGEPNPTIAVIGGGISGVELAGELGHLAAARPPGWRAARVVLVQGGERLLPEITPRAAEKATRYLRSQGVELRLRTRLVELGEGTATLQAGEGPSEVLSCALAFWAGGVRPATALAGLGLPLTDRGWLRVSPTLQCFPGQDGPLSGIFAIGDAARIVD
jgi:NADH dehydrogenase